MRIFDQPNHPAYGPVRRMWVVFQTIFADNYAFVDEEYARIYGDTWDERLARWVSSDAFPDSYNQRHLTRQMLSVSIY